MATAAVKKQRSTARSVERLLKRQAAAPSKPAPVELLQRLSRLGEHHFAGTPPLDVTPPPESYQDERAFKAVDDDTLDPRMQDRLVRPLSQAGYRALMASDHEYGPEMAVVVRTTESKMVGTFLFTYPTDKVVIGRLSAIQRNFPDKWTVESMTIAGVDTAWLTTPDRMELA